MTRHPIQIVTLTATLGLIGLFAMGQTTSPPEDAAGRGYKSTGDSAEKPGKRADEVNGMMAKIPDDMKMRCQMQMNMAVSPSDPGAILALKDQLQLTTDQTTELEAINAEARTKAVAVLNSEQRSTLDTLPQSPQTMTKLHEKMIIQMQPMDGAKPGDKPMDCPVMRMMRDQTASMTPPMADTHAASAERKPTKAPTTN